MDEPNRDQRRAVDPELEYAAELLGDGNSPDDVRQRLVERGLSQEAADAVVHELFMRAIFVETTNLFNQGYSPEEVRSKLLEKGLEEATANAVVDRVLAQNQTTSEQGDFEAAAFLKILGVVVFAIGVGLLIGNVTGMLRTFPFAGFLGMFVGGAIYGAGEKAK